jgi:arylsulfatase
MFLFNGAAEFETPDYLIANVDNIGTPAAYNHYAVGWAHAMCTPYQWTKQVASHWGGTAMVRSSTGRMASRPKARSAPSSTT